MGAVTAAVWANSRKVLSYHFNVIIGIPPPIKESNRVIFETEILLLSLIYLKNAKTRNLSNKKRMINKKIQSDLSLSEQIIDR